MFRNCIMAIGVLALGVSAAQAIIAPPRDGWQLSSTVSTASGANSLALGQFTFQNGPADGPVTQIGRATLPTGLEQSRFQSNVTGIRVASIAKGAYTLSDVIATGNTSRVFIPSDDVFNLKLKLMDEMSGEMKEMTFTGKPKLTIGSDFGSVGELSLNFNGDGMQTANLGGKRYDVKLGVSGTGSASYITADISCTPGTPGVPGVPEPATLALAGIGLAGLVGARLRRRNA
jgi:hypothetical protein